MNPWKEYALALKAYHDCVTSIAAHVDWGDNVPNNLLDDEFVLENKMIAARKHLVACGEDDPGS
jgi:hypothetical protein